MSMMPPAVPKPEVPAVNRKEFGFGKSPSGQDAVILFGKEVPVPIAVAVVGGLGALLLFLRAKSSGSNVISAGTTAAPQTASSTAYDPDSQAIADLQTAVTDLANEIPAPTSAVASTPSPAVATAPAAPPVGPFAGSGYGPDTGASGVESGLTTAGQAENFVWASSAGVVNGLLSSGQMVYYQPTPGVFAPAPGQASAPNAGPIGAGTALFYATPFSSVASAAVSGG
jgi:hypothetical protein